MEIELGQPPDPATAPVRRHLMTYARKLDTDRDALRESVLARRGLALGTRQAGWNIFSARRVCALMKA